MTTAPSTTPAVTGDSCGLPSARVVPRMTWCRVRTNSRSSSRSARRLVAIVRGLMPCPYPPGGRSARLLPPVDRQGVVGVGLALAVDVVRVVVADDRDQERVRREGLQLVGGDVR